jgi:hypothetical protein
MKHKRIAGLVAAVIIAIPSVAAAGGFRGSPSSMREQHAVAVERDLAFINDAAEVRALLEDGRIELVESGPDYTLADVSFPYALPEVKLFIERLGKQYREANGAPLVVTSLTRPAANQPRNAHELSVHPAGMAVDFRVPRDGKARAWLESVLLQLENRGVLDVTRERFPPHYHVAVFPAAYAAYVENLPVVDEPEPAVVPALPAPSVTETAAPSVAAAATSTGDGNHSQLALVVMISLSAIVLLAMATRRYALS